MFTGGGDEAAIAARRLRHVPDVATCATARWRRSTMYDEKNTGTNLPAEIKIAAVDGDAYKFLFMAKGGGSANKSYLFQETKALLNEATLLPWIFDKMQTLGTAACPPYHLAVVDRRHVGRVRRRDGQAGHRRNTSTRCRPTGSPGGHGFRDVELEKARCCSSPSTTGIGAQFGGKYFCHDVRIIRLPRHGASCPVAMAVSCSADRQALGKITADGVFLEQLETDPARFLPEVDRRAPRRRQRGRCTSTSTGRWTRSAPSSSKLPGDARG